MIDSFHASRLNAFKESPLSARNTTSPQCSGWSSIAIDSDFYDQSRDITLTFTDDQWQGEKIQIQATLTDGVDSESYTSTVTVGTLVEGPPGTFTYTFAYDVTNVRNAFSATHAASDGLTAAGTLATSTVIKSLPNNEAWRLTTLSIAATATGVPSCSKTPINTSQYVAICLYVDMTGTGLWWAQVMSTATGLNYIFARSSIGAYTNVIETTPTQYWIREEGNYSSDNWEDHISEAATTVYTSWNTGLGAASPTTDVEDDLIPSVEAEQRIYGSYPGGNGWRTNHVYFVRLDWVTKSASLYTNFLSGMAYTSQTAIVSHLNSATQSFISSRVAVPCPVSGFYKVTHNTGMTVDASCAFGGLPSWSPPSYQGLWSL